MDREQIKIERFVERYLTGDLLVREAWDFERYCKEHPEVLDTLDIPARIKARLKVNTFDGMGTSVFEAMPADVTRLAAATGLQRVDPATAGKQKQDEDEDEDDYDPAPTKSGINKILLLLLILTLLGAGWLYWGNQDQQRQLRTMSVAAKVSGLRATTSVQTIRATPATTQASEPTVTVSTKHAEWLDVHLDVSNSRYKVFGILISKVNESRVLEIRRISVDTNKELRFSLNSTAFGSGEYEIKLQGYNYKGQTSDVGWMLLNLQ
ncbi:MAG: hypothetical protein AB7U99_00495 [Steroidobacteraceae bacterium]